MWGVREGGGEELRFVGGCGCREKMRLSRFRSRLAGRLPAVTGKAYAGRPLGSKQFIAGLEKTLGRILEVRTGGRTRQIADGCADQLQFWNAE